MLQVGLTGGIGSGKSTVARRLVQRGALLIDADVLAREVVEPGTDGLAEIVAAFGPGCSTPTARWTGPPWPRWCSATGRPGNGSTASCTRGSAAGPPS